MDNNKKDDGQEVLSNNENGYKIHLLNIIGEIEGHECLPDNTKTTQYEHVLPELAKVQEDSSIDGMLVLLNTVGGGHSIGVPLSTSGKYSFIVSTATMIVHPIRMNGTVIGVKHNYEYIERMQDRIIEFTANHANIDEKSIRKLMFNTGELAKDVGSMLVGKEAVDAGLIDEIGGIGESINKLYQLIKK